LKPRLILCEKLSYYRKVWQRAPPMVGNSFALLARNVVARMRATINYDICMNPQDMWNYYSFRAQITLKWTVVSYILSRVEINATHYLSRWMIILLFVGVRLVGSFSQMPYLVWIVAEKVEWWASQFSLIQLSGVVQKQEIIFLSATSAENRPIVIDLEWRYKSIDSLHIFWWCKKQFANLPRHFDRRLNVKIYRRRV